MKYKEHMAHAMLNFFNSEGRASFEEFWWFAATLWIAFPVLILLGIQAGNAAEGMTPEQIRTAFAFYVLLLCVFAMAGYLTIQVRRLHDLDLSGAYALFNFVPVIGSVGLLVLMGMPGTPDNRFGPEPERGIDNETFE